MTEVLIKLRVLRNRMVQAGRRLVCTIRGHRWVTLSSEATCDRCGRPAW